MTSENTFNRYHLELVGNHKSSKDGKKKVFLALLDHFDQCLNFKTAKYVYLPFSRIVSVLQYLIHFV